MQIASDEMVFIFDLIKLAEDVSDVLDSCLTRILQSPGILKLGMRSKHSCFPRIILIYTESDSSRSIYITFRTLN